MANKVRAEMKLDNVRRNMTKQKNLLKLKKNG